MPDGAPAHATISELLSLDRFRLTAHTAHDDAPGTRRFRRLGLPLGILAYLAIEYAPRDPGLTAAGQVALAAFALALVWWVTEPIPTHLTSLVLMLILIVGRAWGSADVLAVLGLDVIWLNVMAFILSAMLVRTHLAKRLALAVLARFGHRATWALGAFALLQLVLAPLIPATAARAALTLPLMTATAAIYGSTAEHPGNFGRNLLLLNLTAISILSSTVMTGSAANVMAVGFLETLAGHKVYYTDWVVAGAPIAIAVVLLAWVLGPRVIFPLAAEEHRPRIAGGIDLVREELRRMGPLSGAERKAIAIFVAVIGLWATDRFHEAWFGMALGPTVVAMGGAIVALWPRLGVIEWDETEIPWHLMIFSAGAYAGGLAIEKTGAAGWAVEQVFGTLPLGHLPFGWAYAVVIGVMLYSHLLSTSKTVRTVIMIPAIILLARRLGWDPVSLALPAAFTIDWVIGLPISGKPNVILFATGQYSARDNLRYGLVVCTLGYLLLLLAGATWFHWLGLTPAFGALP